MTPYTEETFPNAEDIQNFRNSPAIRPTPPRGAFLDAFLPPLHLLPW